MRMFINRKLADPTDKTNIKKDKNIVCDQCDTTWYETNCVNEYCNINGDLSDEIEVWDVDFYKEKPENGFILAIAKCHCGNFLAMELSYENGDSVVFKRQ
jgi:hypothetical protein